MPWTVCALVTDRCPTVRPVFSLTRASVTSQLLDAGVVAVARFGGADEGRHFDVLRRCVLRGVARTVWCSARTTPLEGRLVV